MATKVLMPKLGLTMTEGKIVRWIKQEGDPVKKGEPLLRRLLTRLKQPLSYKLEKNYS